MKKLISLLMLMILAISLWYVPTLSLANDATPVNYNLYTTTIVTHDTNRGLNVNDGSLSTVRNHTNRSAGDTVRSHFDLLTLDSRAETAGIPQRTEVPKYNKIVFRIFNWNTGALTVYHGNSINNDNAYDVTDRGWTEERKINSYGKAGTELCFADTYQSFSFDTTTDRYVGYSNDYIFTASSDGKGAFYVYEVEVYYVTPESMEIDCDSVLFVEPGEELTLAAKVLDYAGDVINDSKLNGVTWTLQGNNASVDSKTGVVTISDNFTGLEKITLTAVSDYDSTITATKTITLVNKSEDNQAKSENYLLNASGESAWSGENTKNMVDGNFNTGAQGGNHSAAGWKMTYNMSSRPYVRYNKIVITYGQYNTEYITVKTGLNDTVSDGTNIRKTLNLDYKSSDSKKQVISFDKVFDPYIQIINQYMYATDSTGSEEYRGKNASIFEIEAYYVKPAEILIDAENAYSAGAETVIIPSARIIDSDGDEISDSEFLNVVWSVSGSDDVSVDSSTGVIKINNTIKDTQTITLTATGYNGISCSKEIQLIGSKIGNMVIKDVPGFITTNTVHSGSATFKPDVEIYAHDGSRIEDAEVVWSIKNAPEGITLANAKTGEFTVENTASGEFTLVCMPVSDIETTVYAEKTIRLISFKNGVVEKDGTIYAPADMDISEIRKNITSASIEKIIVLDDKSNEIENGNFTDGYTINVKFDDATISFTLTTRSSLDIEITNSDGTYTAQCTIKEDVPLATIVIAEYESDGRFVKTNFDAKDKAVDTITASLRVDDPANTVKAFLVKNIETLEEIK